MHKRLAVVVTCVDSPDLAQESLRHVKENSTNALTDVFLVDNGSYKPLSRFDADYLIRFPENIGINAVFHESLPELDRLGPYDIIAHFHCDLFLWQRDFDKVIVDAFDNDPKLALAGFMGSDGMWSNGGRCGRILMNFMGHTYGALGNIKASTTEDHGGQRFAGICPGVVLDHLSMIFRTSVLKELSPQREGAFAPHHFGDRWWCAETLEKGYHLAIFGIKIDHLGGGTFKGMNNYLKFARKWLEDRGIECDSVNPDKTMYAVAEKLFLDEWYHKRKFLPVFVDANYNLRHQ